MAPALADTQNARWAKDKSKFGYQMLLKMGWSEGRGTGKNEDGMASHVVVRKRQDKLALGSEEDGVGNRAFVGQIAGFSEVLARLHEEHAPPSKRARASSVSSARSSASEGGRRRRSARGAEAAGAAADEHGPSAAAASDDEEDEEARRARKAARKVAREQRREKKRRAAKDEAAGEVRAVAVTVARKVQHRAVKSKDVSRYSQSDLNAIFGVGV
jgi:Pin2-interacting protein X1